MARKLVFLSLVVSRWRSAIGFLGLSVSRSVVRHQASINGRAYPTPVLIVGDFVLCRIPAAQGDYNWTGGLFQPDRPTVQSIRP